MYISGLFLPILLFLETRDSVALSSPQQEPLSTTPSIRNATKADAKAMTRVIEAAFHDSPHIRYAYQFMDEYPNDHFNCMYENIHKVIGLPYVLAQIAMLPNISEPHKLTPAAAALWVLPTAWRSNILEDRPLRLFGTCRQRDLNITRAEDFERQFGSAKQKCLDNVYAKKNQFYLDTLATHPDYQRQGAGSALVTSGLDFGTSAFKDDNVTATLIATEAGEPLYKYLKWESMSNFSVHSMDVVNGTREEWKFDVMKYRL